MAVITQLKLDKPSFAEQSSGQLTATKIKISGDMMVQVCDDIRDRLLEAVRSYEVTEVDLSEVEHIDATGMFSLLLAKQLGETLGHRVYITAHHLQEVRILDKFSPCFFGHPLVATNTGYMDGVESLTLPR